MPPGVADRTVRITGHDVEQLMRAVALILTKLAQVRLAAAVAAAG